MGESWICGWEPGLVLGSLALMMHSSEAAGRPAYLGSVKYLEITYSGAACFSVLPGSGRVCELLGYVLGRRTYRPRFSRDLQGYLAILMGM